MLFFVKIYLCILCSMCDYICIDMINIYKHMIHACTCIDMCVYIIRWWRWVPGVPGWFRFFLADEEFGLALGLGLELGLRSGICCWRWWRCGSWWINPPMEDEIENGSPGFICIFLFWFKTELKNKNWVLFFFLFIKSCKKTRRRSGDLEQYTNKRDC